MDLWDVDVRRCAPFQRNKRYLHDRTVESLGLRYAMHWPFRQAESARGVRKSPLHDRLLSRGACFGEVAGFERPNWFAPPGVKPEYHYSYGRQNWFEYSGMEHTAVREGIGLFDQSSFAKFAVVGVRAEKVLNQICAADIAVPVGKLAYTQWLNERGGIEADLTVTREAQDRYLVVTACATQTRDFHWLQSHMFGHTAGRPLALGYVSNAEGTASPEWVKSGHYEIEIAAERLPTEVSLQPFTTAPRRESSYPEPWNYG
jgi:4-methylaminobutanoate oxidase (formaldehyde-forming)